MIAIEYATLHDLSCDGPTACTCRPIMVKADPPRAVEGHWVCPDCGLPCTCTEDVTNVVHRRCGGRP